MGNLSKEGQHNHEEFDAIPVVYCAECLSLRVLPLDEHIDYCDQCGSTNIKEADIHEWEKMYEAKYGKSYLKS